MNSVAEREQILKVIKGTKEYGGVPAIKDVDFDLYRGEVHALAGENGAGKTTLAKALTGAIELTSGQIFFEGVERRFRSPAEGLEAGIIMVYQETSLVPTMTVGQNMILGREKLLNRLTQVAISAQQVLQSMNFKVNPTALVSSLGAAQKQMVEIARAIMFNSSVIIFDEPTAALSPEEKMHFFDLMRALTRRKVSVIYISHALEESLELADRITVLRDGRRIITAEASVMTRESLIQNMVGRDMAQTHYVRQEGIKDESKKRNKKKALRVQNVYMSNMVRNFSFSLYRGEITGMFGLVGSGRTEMSKIVYGALKRRFLYGGMIYLDDRPVRYRVPRQAVKDGIAYITEDRKLNGFFETMTPSNNIYIGSVVTKLARGFLRSRKKRDQTSKMWLDRLNIQTLTRDSKMIELSGGNQQKVVLAKAMVQKPKVAIFDEPTRGVDVNSIGEIHNFIRSLAKENIAILLISSYLPEILALSDRILITQQGHVVEEFRPEETTEEKIMFAAIH